MRYVGGHRKQRDTIIHRALALIVVIIALWTRPSSGESKKIPPEISTAKTIYIENETQDPALVDAAKNEFENWGRFTVANSEADAELKVVFRHKYGMDLLTNVSFIVMDVYTRGQKDPAFEAKNAMKNILSSEYRTRACIRELRNRMEPKH